MNYARPTNKFAISGNQELSFPNFKLDPGHSLKKCSIDCECPDNAAWLAAAEKRLCLCFSISPGAFRPRRYDVDVLQDARLRAETPGMMRALVLLKNRK